MTTIVTDSIEGSGLAPLRGILVDPYSRSVRPVNVPAAARPCGCVDADGLALVDLLGRRQEAHMVLDGEILLVGVGSSSAAWCWGTIRCEGYGLVLGGQWAHAFADSRAAVGDALDCVSWGQRRRRSKMKEKLDGASA